MSFWGATATSSKPFEESVPTNANLVVSHVSLAGPTDGVTTLMCTVDGIEGDFVVAHLTWNRTEQASVDLVYPLGSDVKFTVKGKGEVHLLGMYDPVDDMNMGYSSDEEGMMFGSEDSDLEGEDEEDSDEALRMQYGTGRGPKITELPENSDDEEEDSDEDEGVAVPVQQPKKQGGQQQGQKQGGQQQKQGGQQQGQKQGGQQGQKQGGQQQKQGGQQQGQKQGGQQQGNNQGQKRKAQDSPNQPQKKQKTGQSPNNQQKRK